MLVLWGVSPFVPSTRGSLDAPCSVGAGGAPAGGCFLQTPLHFISFSDILEDLVHSAYEMHVCMLKAGDQAACKKKCLTGALLL